jgi:hypothetical protein
MRSVRACFYGDVRNLPSNRLALIVFNKSWCLLPPSKLSCYGNNAGFISRPQDIYPLSLQAVQWRHKGRVGLIAPYLHSECAEFESRAPILTDIFRFVSAPPPTQNVGYFLDYATTVSFQILSSSFVTTSRRSVFSNSNPRGKTRSYSLNKRVGSRCGENNLLSLYGIEPRSLGRPVRMVIIVPTVATQR